MHTTIKQWIVEILEHRICVASIAARQRAKFEGWLKFELAAYGLQHGATAVEVESPSSASNPLHERSDITFYLSHSRYDLELKTPNTNWRLVEVVNKTRPITKNITGIVYDAQKLKYSPGQGIVAFVLFPIPIQDRRWLECLQRISVAIGIPLSEQEHCSWVTVPVGKQNFVDFIVCCFVVPRSDGLV
jgi:hypothetical protein